MASKNKKLGKRVNEILTRWRAERGELPEDTEDFTDEAAAIDLEFFDELTGAWDDLMKKHIRERAAEIECPDPNVGMPDVISEEDKL